MNQPQLQRLLESLTQVFRSEAILKPVFTLSFSLPNCIAKVTLTGHTLVIDIQETNTSDSLFDFIYRVRELSVTSSVSFDRAVLLPVMDLTYDLRDWTIERLVEDLNAHQGITATIIDQRLKKLLAGAIAGDFVEFDLSVLSLTLSVDANPLTVFLRPVAFAIEDHENNIDTALAQLNILTSKKYFADYWGVFIGITRRANESDIDYTQRIVNEVLLKRDNNRALEEIIFRTFNLRATVDDLLPLVLIINNAICFSKIPGEVYNVGNFLVTAELTTDDIITLVNRHKAGGTRAFFRRILETSLLLGDPVLTTDFFDLSLFDAQFFPAQPLGVFSGINNFISEIETGLPVWKVGSTPMPGTQIV